MNQFLPAYKAEEYVTVTALIVIIFFCALLAVFLNSDPIIIATAVGLLGGVMIYAEQLAPIHFFYAICFGASFLPYINLSMFPLAGVYIIAFLFITLVLISFLKEKRKIQLPVPAKSMFLFLAIGLFSVIGAPDKRQVIIYVGQFFVYICIYIAAANILEKKGQIIRSLKYVLWGSVIPLVACLVQLLVSFKSLKAVVDLFYQSVWGKLFMGAKGLERLSGEGTVIINRASNVGGELGDVLFRVFGTYVGPTGFGSYLMLMTILAGALLIIQRDKKRVGLSQAVNAFLFIILAIFLILTWTRSAWLAFFVALAFILVYRNEQKVKLLTKKNIALFFIIIAIPLALFIALLVLKIPLATTVLTSIIAVEGIGGSVAARLGTMLFSLKYIVEHPLLGIGWGNYGYVSPQLNITSSSATFASAHNRYLELGVELGLPGLIAFVLIIYSFIKQTLSLIKAPLNSFYHTLGIAFLAIWIGYLIKSFFEGSVIHPRTMTLLWALAGIQTAAFQLYFNEKKKEHTVYRLQAAR